MLSPFYGKLRTDFCSFRFQTTFCASHYLKGRLKTETDYKQSDIQNRIFSDDRSLFAANPPRPKFAPHTSPKENE